MREKIHALERYYSNIIHCNVILEALHHHHKKGNIYNVKIELHVPEKEIVVSSMRNDKHAHEDIYIAIRDAFNSATRRLEDYVRVRRGDIKSHETTSRGSHGKRNFDNTKA